MASKTSKKNTTHAALLMAMTLSLSGAANAAAPQQLYNKTITITWGESGTYKRISDGMNTNPVGQFQATVYVSSAGRPFLRVTNTSGRYGGKREAGPETSSGGIQFNGNTLTMVRENIGIARRLLTTFDGSFASCSTTVTIGKINAQATMKGFDGAEYHIISMQPGAASCSIREGNALAN